jgi:hypothetical protein
MVDSTHVSAKVPLRCRCGHLRGVASVTWPSAGLRFICYCKDCQAFAHFLKRPDVLDDAGGTDIFQMPVGRIKLTAGTDAVRCVRLSANGVYRWYSDCCHTPIGNTAGPRFPLIGLIHSFMDHEADSHSRGEVLGAPLCRLFERSATGPLPTNAPPPPSSKIFVLRISRLFGWWWLGLNKPNPFFDERTGNPLSFPRLLTASEHAALRG